MNEQQMDRKQVVEALIENELVWLHENFDKHALTQVTEFFAKGGFEAWTDKALLTKYNDVYGEEKPNETTY